MGDADKALRSFSKGRPLNSGCLLAKHVEKPHDASTWMQLATTVATHLEHDAVIDTVDERVNGTRVNSAEHEESFCRCVNLYVDYVVVRAMRYSVGDFVKNLEEGGSSSSSMKYGYKEKSDPVFSITDDYYMDVIDSEIQSTIQSDDVTGACFDMKVGTVKEPTLGTETTSSEEQASNELFELAAENYLNTSFHEEGEHNVDSVDAFNDATSFIPYATTLKKVPVTVYRTTQQPKRNYEFEVDCETGMISSQEIVDPDIFDESHGNNAAEAHAQVLDMADGDNSLCFVEFEPDDDDCFFQVINRNDDDAVDVVFDENAADAELTKKMSSFRARSPTKLPRSIRDGTDGPRRRCFSVGDADRYEILNSPSNEFYSHPDIIDRICTLPSPPRSHPEASDADNDSDNDGHSSSQEELDGFLNSPESVESGFNDVENLAEDSNFPVSSTQRSTNTFSDTAAHCDSSFLAAADHVCCEGSSASAKSHSMSFNTNHRVASNNRYCNTDIYFVNEHRNTSMIGPSSDSHCLPKLHADHHHLNTHEQEVGDDYDDATLRDDCRRRQAAKATNRVNDVDGHGGGDDDNQDKQPFIEDENAFDYILRNQGRLRRREVKEFLSDLGREHDAMTRMLRDARRAKAEFSRLKDGVTNLLARLESRILQE